MRPEPKSSTAPAKPAPGSFRELCARYLGFLSKDTTLADRTKYIRRRHLDEVCQTKIKTKGGERAVADMPVEAMTTAHVHVILDVKREKPEAANDRRKVLLALFKWAGPRGHAKQNPVKDTEKIRTNSEGFATWGQEHIDRFVAIHPLGTKPYLALALLFYTGQRRADVVRFGRQHVKGGKLHFVQQKNERSLHKQMTLTILPPLQEAIDRTVPRDQLTFLVTEFSKPFTSNGFGNWFRDKCDQAGLQGYSAHGLRKALQTIGSEMDLTDRELMAVAGHETAAMTTKYTRKRDRDRLADSGMAKLSKLQIGAPGIRPSESAPDQAES